MPRPNDVALVQRRQVVLAKLRTSTSTAVAKAWDSLDAYSDAEIELFIRRAHPALAAGQERAFWLTVSHLQALLGENVDADLALLDSAQIDLEQPFIAMRRSLAAGDAFHLAVAAGRARAEGVGESGVQWASRAANQALDDEPRIHGWRRTLTRKACSWCQQVAEQIYRSADSASFGHLHCDCGVDPIIESRDPGRVVNSQVLDDLES